MPKMPRKNNRVSRRDFLTCLGTAPIAAALLGRPANAGARERDDGKEREVRGDKDKKKLLACLGGEWVKPHSAVAAIKNGAPLARAGMKPRLLSSTSGRGLSHMVLNRMSCVAWSTCARLDGINR